MKILIAAKRNLQGIVDYIARDNPCAAISFGQRIEPACLRIARFPRLGTIRDNLGERIRIFPVGSYVVYYRQEQDDTVRIVRVIHGARDESSFTLDE